MKNLRNWAPPLIGLFALLVLFFKLPETPSLGEFFECHKCTINTPYVTLIGAGYFTFLIALALLIPSFPNRKLARIGLIWSILLFLVLTYCNFPNVCLACLISHICHMLMWTIWFFIPSPKNAPPYGWDKIFMAFIAAIAMTSLYGSFNLTFMTYTLEKHRTLQEGDTVPDFFLKTPSKGLMINFVSPGCPYCKEQLDILGPIITSSKAEGYRFINITPTLSPELIQEAPQAEWIEDKDGSLRHHFRISGFPTLFLVEPNGKIDQVIPGVHKLLESKVEAFIK